MMLVLLASVLTLASCGVLAYLDDRTRIESLVYQPDPTPLPLARRIDPRHADLPIQSAWAWVQDDR